ncbi:hypothetical protein HGRIS_007914 [Hohenbuehelia grisea]|uniref:P-loop containing nucleoside triphosphate hydrolase protein n=1 Tax=Hohenbuehelia grisea TaxID=104357 RepID=A0ABR3J6A4_9AGAR
MRLAILVHPRRRLLMQLDPTKLSRSLSPSSSLLSSARNSLKRPYASQATAEKPHPSTAAMPNPFSQEDSGPSSSSANKVQRVNSDQPSSSFTFSRRTAAPPPPQFKMPSSSGQRSARGGSAPRTPRSASSSGPPHSHKPSSSKQSQRGGRSNGRGEKLRGMKSLDLPLNDQAYITETYRRGPQLKTIHEESPKSSLGNFSSISTSKMPSYTSIQGLYSTGGKMVTMWRTTATLELDPPVIGVGDATEKKESEKLAALAVVYQLDGMGILDNPKSLVKSTDVATTTLSDGSVVGYERARIFMDYYCRRFRFPRAEVTLQENARKNGWEAIMTVDERRIGLGQGSTKKAAQMACYLDVTAYLEKCDAGLWTTFLEASKTGADLGLAPRVVFQPSLRLDDSIRELCADVKHSVLYKNRPAVGATTQSTSTEISAVPTGPRRARRPWSPEQLAQKSEKLLKRLEAYKTDPKVAKIREQRMSLPVYSRAEDVLSQIRQNDVTICMAATGSGKTTQIPQLILDEFIARGEGAKCNIICTQPRRLAAISVALRVANERGETLGQSVGYQVRFENKPPEEHGSIAFCTTGIFLKRMHTALAEMSGTQSLDDVTHVVVDEVHERDVDTDLLLVVLKRLLADRKARGKPLKVVLMSATIDPTLFQNYFPDDNGMPAKVVSVPGRSFPVTKYFMEDYVPQLVASPARWVFSQDSVVKYLIRELGAQAAAGMGIRLANNANMPSEDVDLELPYPLICLTISHVLQRTDSGHVLVFLPGWDDIMAVQKTLANPAAPLGLNFSDTSKYSIHLLHSTIPLAEQQVIFDPPPAGVRRIILATNIAETSITIPDVVYVIDTAKVKEQRYDPERHMSSLVSAWVGSSNLNQRAGRAGRHRSGEYFGILSRQHAENLNAYQTVEMKRVDLSNVVMHVKALDFPGMGVEEVLAACIEAPAADRVEAALKELCMVGALDENQNLTSLGRVLLQLPIEVQVGRLVLYGSFFRCLDNALTLAAIMANRDPFVSPLHLKQEANAKKNSWSPGDFRSDILATLQAYNAWWEMQSRGNYVQANRFCLDNFLSKPTLLLIQKIRTHLLQSLHHAGVLDVSTRGQFVDLGDSNRNITVPPELNTNKDSLPLLAALITVASQPKFAIRIGEKMYRTRQDAVSFLLHFCLIITEPCPENLHSPIERQQPPA